MAYIKLYQTNTLIKNPRQFKNRAGFEQPSNHLSAAELPPLAFQRKELLFYILFRTFCTTQAAPNRKAIAFYLFSTQ
jgi:hypothetical protein